MQGNSLCIMFCKLSTTVAQGISSQTLTWRHKDLKRRTGGKSTFSESSGAAFTCTNRAHTPTHKANIVQILTMASFPNLNFQGQVASKALVDCVSKSMMKSHIFHIPLLHSALLPNTVFNKHLKTASRQY